MGLPRSCLVAVEHNLFIDCRTVLYISNFLNGWGASQYESYLNIWKRGLAEVHFDRPPYSERYPELLTFFEEDHIIKIRSVIMVERDTQKGIIIGHKGAALKRVGIEARKDLEKFFDKKIHLELYVKVNKNWRSDKKQLRRFGYND